jgi:tetratricopeptide (TPR) repeat protein
MSFITRHIWMATSVCTVTACLLFALLFYPRGIDHEAQLAHAAERHRAYVLLDAGIAAQYAGDLSAARKNYEAALAIDEKLVRAQLMMGELELVEGNVKGAIEHFDTALNRWERQADALNSRGVAKWRDNNRRSAIRDFDRAMALDPNFDRARTNRGLLLLREGDWQRAQQDFEASIKGEEELTRVPRSVMGLGVAYALAGLPDQAIDTFSILVDYPGPIALDALYNRARAHEAKGDTAAAQRDRETMKRLEDMGDDAFGMQAPPGETEAQKGSVTR